MIAQRNQDQNLPHGQGEFGYNPNSPQHVYQACMSLCKQRLTILKNAQFDRMDWLDVERSALNIRKVCESVALGCLAAADLNFGDVSKRYKRGWQADRQIRYALSKCEDCFPKTAHLSLNLDTRQHHIEYEIGHVLSANELIDIWIDVANVLHELNPYRQRLDIEVWRLKLERYTRALYALLSVHVMQLSDFALVVVFGEDDQQPPSTITAKARPG